MENCNSFRVQNQLWVFLRWISVWGSRKLEVIVGCEVDIEFLEWKPVDMCVIVARCGYLILVMAIYVLVALICSQKNMNVEVFLS